MLASLAAVRLSGCDSKQKRPAYGLHVGIGVANKNGHPKVPDFFNY